MLTRGRTGLRKFSTAVPRARPGRDDGPIIGTMTHPDYGGLARFFTLAETAEVLAVSVSQAYALVRSGELPAIKIGGNGHWRVERTVLQAYIDGKYEENRRRALWQQAEYADVAELFVER
jgi:excisionase family DNA binding protein